MTKFLEIVPEKLCAKISFSYEIFSANFLSKNRGKKISWIPSKLSCMRQVSEFLQVIIPPERLTILLR